MQVKVESEKAGLKLNIQKTKIMASGPITSWEIDGETVETVSDFIFGGPKSLQMVTPAMKLKDTYFLSPCLFNLYAEYIMQHAGLDEIKIAERNINNLSYAEDTTLMAKSEKELKSLLMKVKEEHEKTILKFSIQKTNGIWSHLMANRWENNGNSERLNFLGFQNYCRW